MNFSFAHSHTQGFLNLVNSPFSLAFCICFLSLIGGATYIYCYPNPQRERVIFWIASLMLILFSAFRPVGLGIDDAGYVLYTKNICSFLECFKLIQSPRDYVWFSLVGLLKSFFSGEQAILLISAAGVFIQLYCIDRLCRQKLLALILFTPLIYLLFDLTILRAGFALGWYFLAIFFLVRSKFFLGGTLLASNFLTHSQAIFSIALAPFLWLSKKRRLAIALIALCLLGMYLQITPTIDQLSLFTSASVQPYLEKAMDGGYEGENKFPVIDLLLMIYLAAIIIKEDINKFSSKLNQYIVASALLAIFLAWFFAPIHAVQTRLFDFYIAPIVFLAGNLRQNKYLFFGTIFLSILIYIRMEVIHNFILG